MGETKRRLDGTGKHSRHHGDEVLAVVPNMYQQFPEDAGKIAETTAPRRTLRTPPPWKPDKQPVDAAQTASNAVANAQAEMVKELREAYQADQEMPPNVRKVVEKHDPMSGRNLSAAMNKATKSLDKARDSMRKLQDAKANHRTQWMKHMKSLMETLEKQVEAFDQQQDQYIQKIRTAQKEVQNARQDLQKLTEQAAASHSTEILINNEDDEEKSEVAVDVDEDGLRTQVYDLLSKCLRKSDKAAVVEIPSDEEHMDTSAERQSKRPRSVEPYGSAGK